jgi:hypothetical protein
MQGLYLILIPPFFFVCFKTWIQMQGLYLYVYDMFVRSATRERHQNLQIHWKRHKMPWDLLEKRHKKLIFLFKKDWVSPKLSSRF